MFQNLQAIKHLKAFRQLKTFKLFKPTKRFTSFEPFKQFKPFKNYKPTEHLPLAFNVTAFKGTFNGTFKNKLTAYNGLQPLFFPLGFHCMKAPHVGSAKQFTIATANAVTGADAPAVLAIT